MKSYSVSVIVKQINWSNTSILIANNEKKRSKKFSKLYIKKEFADRIEQKKKLRLLLANKKTMNLFLDYLKSTKIGKREKIREQKRK